MKRNLLAGFIAAISASGALAGEAVFYVTEQGQPVDTLSITVNGDRKLVGKNGFASFELGGGTHQVELSEFGQWAGEFEFDASAQQNAEIQVEMIGGEAVPEISVYTPGQEEAPVYGQISGYIESDETGGGVEGATITVAGAGVSVQTDGEGYYELELPRGEYNLSIEHPTYGARDISDLRVIGNYATAMNVNMSMSGDSAIEEVVAVGSYIPSTAISSQRDASGVLDAIGSEQFSRYGDSSAASALKRVTGVTVSGGKYAVVRGLNERYTSVLFNGANLPSPDPTRRVVPLDVFPSAVISSINVSKTASANLAADSAGATINLISKDTPTEFEGEFKVSTSYIDGTTGESATSQKTEGLEIFGFGDSSRDASSSIKALKNQSSTTSLSGADAASALDLSQWETEEITINPDLSLEASVGDLLGSFSYGDLSYKATARYSNKWDLKEIDRANYGVLNASEGTFKEQDEYVETRLSNNIDLSGAFQLSLIGADYSVSSNSMILRNTQQDSVSQKGVTGENRTFNAKKEYTWQEREFLLQQFKGDLLFPEFLDSKIDWSLTYSNASLNLPDSRSYSLWVPSSENNSPINDQFDPFANDRSDELVIFTTEPVSREFVNLEDEAIDVNIAGDFTLLFADSYDLKISTGFSFMDRSREVEADRFEYNLPLQLPSQYQGSNDISDVLNDDFFDDTNTTLETNPDYKASYDGDWEYMSYFVMPRFDLYDVFKLEVGARIEDSSLSVKTAVNPDTLAFTEASVEDDNLYPSLNFTLTAIEDAQFRVSYYESINRPDFREITPAQFKDSVTGDSYIGNENLESADIKNIDLRAEYYFSESESMSIGFFNKEITNAIERTTNLVAGSSNNIVYGFDNGGDAYAQGIEISASKDFELGRFGLRLSANTSIFDTEVEELNDSGNVRRKRDMQGQPDILANLQIALDDYETEREITLVVNHTGESLFAVPATNKLDDEVLLARTVVDLRYKQPLMQNLSLSASIENLLQEDVEQQQSGKLTKRYSPGMEFSLGVKFNF